MYNYPYSIFDQATLDSYINQLQTAQACEQHHKEQQDNIRELQEAIAKYCKAARKVSPDYRQAATNACFEEIARQALLDGMGTNYGG